MTALLHDAVVAPFLNYGFMQRALCGSLLLSLSACPVGVFLTLRRMSLTGDAMAHAILPGAAIGFLLYGLKLVPMTVGGLVAGLVVALAAGAVSRLTVQKEDSSLAAFYLISLAAGVLIVSMRGSSIDLMHVLFGTVLALDDAALWLIASIALFTWVSLFLFWRGLVAECLDPLFLRSVSGIGTPVHLLFLGLVVLNLVGGFQALGTLLAVGLMILPAAAARFWVSHVVSMCVLAVVIGAAASVAGLRLAALRAGDHPVLRGSLSRIRACRAARARGLAPAPASPPHHMNRMGVTMLTRLRLKALAAALVTLPAFAGPLMAKELKVIASFSIIGDLARNVGGEGIELATLVGPNGDAHIYEPRPKDAMTVAAADVILANGLQFEGFLARLIEASGTEAAVVELTDGAALLKDPEGGHWHHYADRSVFHEGLHDPHAWQSIPNVKVYVANIADAFCAADNQGCGTYRTNAQAYTEELEALDRKVREMIDAIPQDRRTVIVGHAAFRYFETEYGVRFLAPTGLSTEADASAAGIAGIIDQIRADEAAAIFIENISDPRLMQRIADETGLAIAGTLYSDALSDESDPAPTYTAMMGHNAKTIADALGVSE